MIQNSKEVIVTSANSGLPLSIFKDVVVLLEDGLSSKMQAEMLVLVDVLHKPAAIFPLNSVFRQRSQDKRFIAK